MLGQYIQELWPQNKQLGYAHLGRMAEGVHFKSDNNFSFALVDNVMMQAFVEAYEKGRDT